MSSYIPLHVHSHYSLLDGLVKPQDLILQAKEFEMPAIALTDHGVMYGVIEFYQKALEAEINPIVGVEFYLAPRTRYDKEPKIDNYPFHLILLAKNYQGYQNLIQLVTLSHLEGFYYKPRIDSEILKKYSQGLICLSACLQGEIPRLILAGKIGEAERRALSYLSLFGKENFYFELQPHQIPDQIKVNRQLIAFSKKLKIPLVATSDVHYLGSEDKDAHEVLLAVSTNKDIDDEKRLTLKEVDVSLYPPKKMEEIFKETPQALENTLKIASTCNLKIPLKGLILPHFPIPEGKKPIQYLRQLAHQGFSQHYKKDDFLAKKRLDYELKIIEKTGFANYFLIVADFVSWAKNQGILVGPGRGSAAGSIVSFCLGITNINPLVYNLVFERFLNPERIAPPDIDLDFADDRRDEVIEYITQKYGSDYVAQIITFGTMAARAAIRDTGRALGMAYSDVDKIAKLIPFGFSLNQALDSIVELKSLYHSDPAVKKLLDMAQKLEGVARHASTHAAGLVISKEPLTSYVPLQHAIGAGQGLITQYSMYDIESIGLLKIDILGLANLTIIQNALRIIRKTQGKEISLEEIPLDDPATFKTIAKGETIGIFQLESDGMRRYLKELRPSHFSDIIAMVALYRPGPMELIKEYIAGKKGVKIAKYLHPKLQPILKETYGIAVYQEQVLQIARDLAGFTLGEADVLRKAIGKKIRRLLIAQKKKFIDGCIKNGIKEDVAGKIFSFIEPFASYSFNRAHATCYALIAYQTAWLKTHFPGEFLAALLTAETQNLDKLAIGMTEAERLGIKVLPPSINESLTNFTLIKQKEREYIRFGLAAIKNVGGKAAQAIVWERGQNGPYKTLTSFLSRLPSSILNKKVIESLAKAGALDSLAERNQVLAGITEIIKYVGKKETTPAQLGLFRSKEEPKLSFPEVSPASKRQKLAWEKELLGMYLTEHPLKEINHLIQENGQPIATLSEELTGQRVRVAGIITGVQKIITKAGEPMIFVRLEDTTAGTEVLVFPKMLQKNTLVWRADNIVAIEGEVNTKDGVVKILAEKVKELARQESISISQEPQSLYLNIPEDLTKDLLLEIKQILIAHPGESRVFLTLSRQGKTSKIEAKSLVLISPPLIEELSQILGKENVIVR